MEGFVGVMGENLTEEEEVSAAAARDEGDDRIEGIESNRRLRRRQQLQQETRCVV